MALLGIIKYLPIIVKKTGTPWRREQRAWSIAPQLNRKTKAFNGVNMEQSAAVKPAKPFPSGKFNPDGILTETSFHWAGGAGPS